MRTLSRPTTSVMAGRWLLPFALAACTGAEPTSNPGRTAAAVAAVVASPTSTSLSVGQSAQLSARAVDDQGQPVNGATITWSSDNSSVATVSDQGVVTARGTGAASIFAQSGIAKGAAAITVTSSVTPAPVSGDWTFCANAGAPCNFVGLRDVRLGAASGPYVMKTVYGIVPCAVYGFDGQDPAPGQALHCDYGPIRTGTLANPSPGMSGMGDVVTVPLGDPGVAAPMLMPADGAPVYTDGSGSFRTTCKLAGLRFDDPVVFPGQPGASHLHVFFGNTGVNAGSTVETIANSGNSTCRGGTLNRTAYWVPAVIDSRTGAAQTPDDGVFYYKTGYNIDPTVVKPLPPGLRMIAGNKAATSAQDFVEWSCRDANTISDGSIPTSCPIGDAVRLTVIFPQCWDGVHLDSPDHKSHMAYPVYRNSPQRSTCPPTHPVTIPEITEHFDYTMTSASRPAYWRLSSDMYATSIRGGFSAHADWMGGWDKATMETIVTQCLNRAVDCGVGSIGNGKALQ